MLNYTLMALIEAAADKKTKAKTADADEPDTAAETDTTGEEDPNADDAGGEDENPAEDTEDTTENEEEDQPEEEENTDENKDDESAEDDFSIDPEEDSTDDEPPPDGLVDPDDDGSGDEMDDDAETNVHTNILQLSKLDRTLAKRKCYMDYQDLRTSITSFRTIIDENEAVVDPDIREIVMDDLDKLYTTVTDYLTYKFTITNYEENLQNYMIFMKTLNTIVMKIATDKNTKPTNNRKSKKDTD